MAVLTVVFGARAGNALAMGPTDHEADDLATLAARVQTLTDLERIRAIPSCYGYGHDLIFKHLGGDHSDAIQALQRCHVDNLVTNVFLFDETKVNSQLHSIADLIRFVEDFAKQQGYTSARNVPGNIQVELTGPSSARVLSSTVAPHFNSGANRLGTDFVEARYVDDVRRGADGVWRSVEFDLVVQQIWRGMGSYPFARP
jgi:hypothetical protein